MGLRSKSDDIHVACCFDHVIENQAGVLIFSCSAKQLCCGPFESMRFTATS